MESASGWRQAIVSSNWAGKDPSLRKAGLILPRIPALSASLEASAGSVHPQKSAAFPYLLFSFFPDAGQSLSMLSLGLWISPAFPKALSLGLHACSTQAHGLVAMPHIWASVKT